MGSFMMTLSPGWGSVVCIFVFRVMTSKMIITGMMIMKRVIALK